jgi:hypothetical protein
MCIFLSLCISLTSKTLYISLTAYIVYIGRYIPIYIFKYVYVHIRVRQQLEYMLKSKTKKKEKRDLYQPRLKEVGAGAGVPPFSLGS